MKLTEVMPAEMVHEPLLSAFVQQQPNWSSQGYVCLADLSQLRARYVNQVLEESKGDLTALEHQVMDSLKKQELLSANVNTEFEQHATFGERLADSMTAFGGSWKFIIIFSVILTFWIGLNSAIVFVRPFDPYPFILLNLVLSCVAALQAPVIMMTQNRQEAKDRLRAEYDYRVNLKAELEIRHLHEKLDYLLMNQWQRLLEIQEIQMELLEELNHKNGTADNRRWANNIRGW